MVEAVEVRKRYHGTDVLRGVKTSVAAGRVLCIIGPSGSGKSTFLRCINHLEPIDGGQLLVDGEPMGYERRGDRLYEVGARKVSRQRSEIGMVFQHFELFAHMTALENVSLAPRLVRGRDRGRVEHDAHELLASVGLADKARAYPSQLSGGQQQRVAIARAMAMHPKLMLFDEPTSALDPELVGEVLGVIRRLADSGMTMVIVTHEMDFARQIGDEVAMFDEGRIIEQGPAEQVLGSPTQARTQAFLERSATR
ncbi:ATP-binding cassette domain-containing protein [Amycolatopsis sp. RM579]|uniref:ATP-binding cassette domain-containing protein n=2 Tax=Amycolatopsis pithecellobii TaxID=664692 RepID=A0A6N7Z894_9PSEU|nr:ATP-binding cassette domain-containing protein [Amycolatopsis pithecellobii]